MLLRSGRRLATLEEAAGATVPRRRCRARSDLFAAPPEEILLDILVRLSAKSVLRCRAVCRLWRRLTSEPAFLLDHHRRQPERQLISSYGADNSSRLEAVHLRSGEFQPFFRFPELFGSHFSFKASCDGLYIVGEYICNPATRQWARVRANPNLWIDNLVGLFRHQPSGEYRVLYWRTSNLPLPMDLSNCPVDYRVLTVGTNKSRRVDSSTLGWKALTALGIFAASVLLYGSLHLHLRCAYHRIVVFDTVAETFRYMRPPPVNPRHGMHLLDMGGNLAVSISKHSMSGMRIFTLQDREHDVWAFQYRIELPVLDIRRFQEQGGFLGEGCVR